MFFICFLCLRLSRSDGRSLQICCRLALQGLLCSVVVLLCTAFCTALFRCSLAYFIVLNVPVFWLLKVCVYVCRKFSPCTSTKGIALIVIWLRVYLLLYNSTFAIQIWFCYSSVLSANTLLLNYRNVIY
ncbi:hypothetical protein SCHPADRAFT_124812 [Schizopora paradoxa]|uniref:Uncharacterized protein n=1 Tax=Schizopora paradoxa TaxID=27342 RepID=A0A0H2S3B4_9AGAM|nr:hypothetical protein SCHPADRAFT_124812 [Schizopora paradoxa]